MTPTPNAFSKVLPYKWERTNGRRTAVQMEGVLLGFPFFKASKPGRSSDTNGGVLPYKLEVFYCTFEQGLGFPKLF